MISSRSENQVRDLAGVQSGRAIGIETESPQRDGCGLADLQWIARVPLQRDIAKKVISFV